MKVLTYGPREAVIVISLAFFLCTLLCNPVFIACATPRTV